MTDYVSFEDISVILDPVMPANAGIRPDAGRERLNGLPLPRE
jgi:hypothetical protein